MRGIATLGPARWRWLLPFSFVLMSAVPWLLMNREGRRQIGFQRAPLESYLLALVGGAVAALSCFALGAAVFGPSPDHWFMSIAGSYKRTIDTTGFSLLRLHLVFTTPALIFSPIGEEIFFRGFFQRALEERLSRRLSTTVECAVFGLVHLCHHGLVRTAAGFTLLPLSGALWVILMFSVALLFAWLRKRSGSLYPAIAAHASFNLVMNLVVFSVLWKFLS